MLASEGSSLRDVPAKMIALENSLRNRSEEMFRSERSSLRILFEEMLASKGLPLRMLASEGW